MSYSVQDLMIHRLLNDNDNAFEMINTTHIIYTCILTKLIITNHTF